MLRRRIAVGLASVSLAMGFLLAGVTETTSATAGPPGGQTTGRVWVTVSAGWDDTCGIGTDHSLWCWGYNGFGALGVGDTTATEADSSGSATPGVA